MHIVLLGDSILDNACHVGENECIHDLLKVALPDAQVSLLAVDGSLVEDIHQQIDEIPIGATHVFVSCGLDDAIDNVDVLNKSAATVEDAFYGLNSHRKIKSRRDDFRAEYRRAIDAIQAKCKNTAAFSVYNKIPNVTSLQFLALSLFNEAILEEIAPRDMPLIDLRVILKDIEDYSSISPTELSLYGGRKIVATIKKVTESEFESGLYV